MKIRLSHDQYEELLTLEEGMCLYVRYKGIEAYITPDPDGNMEYKGRRYTFNFYCPSEVKMTVAKQPEPDGRNYISIIGADLEPNKMHLYDVKTHGAHPVHLIEGGATLTEDKGEFGDGDMGWFWMNTKEYLYFKSKCRQMIVIG